MTSGSGPVAGWASEAAVVPIEPRTLPATTRRRPLRVRPVPVLRQVHHHFRLHPPAAQTTRHRARVGRPGRPAGMGPRSRTPPSHRPAHRAAARRPRSTHRSRHTGGDVTHSGHDPEQLDDPRAVHIDLVTAAHGLTAADYTFPYVTSWASEVDRREPERVVRGTGARVLAASRTVLAATQPEQVASAGAELTAAAGLGTERSAAAREHAGATLALARAPEPTSSAEVEALARLHADAAAFYAAQLAGDGPDAARARAMLAERAVPAAAVTGYQLGYAPPGWTALVDHLRARGYTDAQLLDAGVGLRTRRGGVFRDRLMFPVRDAGGDRVVGFLGRALTESDDTPKYLNSPATALYRKGDVLYGLGAEPSRQALAAGARPVLVEGPLDAIAVTAGGASRYVGVAPCGTALTAAQVAALDTAAGPMAERGVLVAFDNDPGGRQASLRAYELLRQRGRV